MNAIETDSLPFLAIAEKITEALPADVLSHFEYFGPSVDLTYFPERATHVPKVSFRYLPVWGSGSCEGYFAEVLCLEASENRFTVLWRGKTFDPAAAAAVHAHLVSLLCSSGVAVDRVTAQVLGSLKGSLS